MAITVVTWKWGDKYGWHYVTRLAAAVKRNLTIPHRFICVTDDKIEGIETTVIKDPGLTQFPGCIVRLRLFDEVWQRELGGEKFVCLDLDAVITGNLDDTLSRDDPFTILQDINTTNPCPYNGSIWMLKAGYRPDVWDDFTLEKLDKIPKHSFPDDQGWFWHMLPQAAAFGPADGVYGFKKKGWPKGEGLPNNARMVAFPGWRDPEKFAHLPWIREHWCG